MKQKFKLPKKNKLISAKMSIVIITMLLLIMGVGYAKYSTTLTINGTVTGRYIPEGLYDYIVEEEQGESGTTMTYTTDKVSPTKTADAPDYVKMEFTGINISDKYINKIDLTLTYTTKTGSVQSIVMNLIANGITSSQTVTFEKKKTNYEVTVTYDNLHISPNDTFIIKSPNQSFTNQNITINNQIVKVYLEE